MNSLSTTSLAPSEALLQLPTITTLYKDVFAAPPWNEAYRCTCCNQSFGQDTPPNTQCCDQSVVEYYPLDQTTEEIRQCLSLTRARIALALNDNDLVGFSWGWQDTLEATNASKFSLKPEECEKLCSLTGLSADDPFFYLSELGVRQDFRGKGLGRQLYETVLQARDTSQADRIMMRTSKKSPAFAISQSDASFPLEIIFEYRDQLDRVILFR